MRAPLIDDVWASGPDWPLDLRVLPDGGVDLVWTGEALVVAGPDRVARIVRSDPASGACGVRFVPGAAHAIFGRTGEALVDSVVPARDVLGVDEAGRLSERLAAAPVDGRPRLLAAWATSDARHAARRDPAVARAADLLAADPTLRVSEVAGRVGYSDRQLRRAVQRDVGYSPKRLARILRLRRVVALARANRSLSLADAAFAGGFVDQAHLSHECAALGCAPASVLLGR